MLPRSWPAGVSGGLRDFRDLKGRRLHKIEPTPVASPTDLARAVPAGFSPAPGADRFGSCRLLEYWMIIGVDARELESKPTGVGVYLRNILQRLTLPAGARLQLYFKSAVPPDLPDVGAEAVLLRAQGSNVRWQQWTLCREASRRKVDLLFSPANCAPWGFGGVQAVTVHDLSFFRHPQWFGRKERAARQLNTYISLRRSNRVYTVSNFIKDEIAGRFGIGEERIVVTPNGTTEKGLDPEARKRLRALHGLTDARTVLYVGSIFNRRHLPVLIDALRRLDPSCVLVVIGENRTHPPENLAAIARQHGVADRVRLLEYVPDSVVHDYYRMADVFVYLSEYEGFGIPPLEAMSYGVPAVLSSTPAMNTIFRDASVMTTIAGDEVADAIRRCLELPEERERLSKAGLALSANYRWENTARIISHDWERLLAARR